MIPDECASIRSMARWVLPVLVGPSTAVTPAPGARPLENVGGEEEKAMFSGGFFMCWRLSSWRAIGRPFRAPRWLAMTRWAFRVAAFASIVSLCDAYRVAA